MIVKHARASSAFWEPNLAILAVDEASLYSDLVEDHGTAEVSFGQYLEVMLKASHFLHVPNYNK